MQLEQSFLIAVYDRLKADAALQALFEAARGGALTPPLPVYRAVAPADEPYPFLALGLVSDVAWDTSDSEGVEIQFDVSAYSSVSESEAVGLIARVHDLLHDASLTFTGGTCVLIRRAGARADTDGQSYRAAETFRALLRRDRA